MAFKFVTLYKDLEECLALLLSLLRMELGIWFRILEVTVCISLHVNAFGKDTNTFFLTSAMGK